MKNRDKLVEKSDFADIIIRYFMEDADSAADGRMTGKNLGLQITMDSSVDLEKVINTFSKKTAEIYWNYSDDMKHQFVVIKKPVTKEIIKNVAEENIANIEEIVGVKPEWEEGFRGVVQIMVLMVLSKKMTQGQQLANTALV